MRNLLQFISRFHAFFLFVIFQVLSFYLLVQFNAYQHAGFINSANGLIGNLYTYKNNITSYLTLQRTNDELATENATLKSKLRGSFIPVNEHFAMVHDTLMEQKYRYLAAKVLNKSINSQRNYLTLNKGSREGVKPEMGVISNHGLVGIIKNVSPHYSTVVSLLNINFSAGVKLATTGDIGLLKWKGLDYRTARVIDIARHVPVHVGDTLLTRGNSAAYPPNIVVGVVSNVVDEPGSSYQDITINLTVDFSRISYVYIVTNLLGKEQKALEDSLKDSHAQ